MDPKQRPPVNPRHQPETRSTASVQTFEDSEGGLPLDSPEAQARQRQRGGRPGTSSSGPPGSEGAGQK
jgi:hypothetical protein